MWAEPISFTIHVCFSLLFLVKSVLDLFLWPFFMFRRISFIGSEEDLHEKVIINVCVWGCGGEWMPEPKGKIWIFFPTIRGGNSVRQHNLINKAAQTAKWCLGFPLSAFCIVEQFAVLLWSVLYPLTSKIPWLTFCRFKNRLHCYSKEFESLNQWW